MRQLKPSLNIPALCDVMLRWTQRRNQEPLTPRHNAISQEQPAHRHSCIFRQNRMSSNTHTHTHTPQCVSVVSPIHCSSYGTLLLFSCLATYSRGHVTSQRSVGTTNDKHSPTLTFPKQKASNCRGLGSVLGQPCPFLLGYWTRLYSQNFGFPLSLAFHNRSIFLPSPVSDAKHCQLLAAPQSKLTIKISTNSIYITD